MELVCPYYEKGRCKSPLLKEPASHVVDESRCMGDYTSCRLFPKSSDKNQQDDSGKRSFVQVNLLDRIPSSACPSFSVIRIEKGIVAKCNVLDRILVKSQVRLCEERWASCPFQLSV